MPNPKPLTDEAVEVAAKAIKTEQSTLSGQWGATPNQLAQAAVEAAAPYIARAERERIARFLTSDSTCDSILTEDEDQFRAAITAALEAVEDPTPPEGSDQ